MKKLIASVIATGTLLATTALPLFAKIDRVSGPWELTAPNAIVFGCGGGTYDHTLDAVTNDLSDGSFEGEGTYDPNSSYTWDITGDISGDDILFTLVYTGIGAGYTLNGVGMIDTDGSIGGTTDGNCQTFSMGAGSAVRFEGNHGQWVKMSEDKNEAAQSKAGMPEQSKGHTK